MDQPGRFAGCEQAAAQEQQRQATTAVLLAQANFLVLDPLRMAFGANNSLFDRAPGVASLLPMAGWATTKSRHTPGVMPAARGGALAQNQGDIV